MALIECNECGTQISDKASVCPKCGNFLGFTPYENLKNKSTCNYCKCKWS